MVGVVFSDQILYDSARFPDYEVVLVRIDDAWDAYKESRLVIREVLHWPGNIPSIGIVLGVRGVFYTVERNANLFPFDAKFRE